MGLISRDNNKNYLSLKVYGYILILAFCLMGSVVAFAEAEEKLRDLDTDRPHKAEAPRTVDKGHFLIEAEPASIQKATEDNSGGGEDDKFTERYMNTNFKYGITHSTDIQLIFPGYVKQSTREPNGTVTNLQGGTDVMVRLKQNLIGNDSGHFALGLLPYLKTPTGTSNQISNRRYEGGLSIPTETEIVEGWSIEIMPQFDYQYDRERNMYYVAMMNSVCSVHDLTDKLGMFVELFTSVSRRPGSEGLASFDFGFTYLTDPNTQLDVGTYIGLTKGIENLYAFVGVSRRF